MYMLVSELVLVHACVRVRVRVCGSCVCVCVQVNEGFLSDTKFRFSRHHSILTSQAKHLP